MKLNVCIFIISFALLFSHGNAISWVFTRAGRFTVDVIQTVIQRMQHMITLVDPNRLYPAGTTIVTFVQLSYNTAIQVRMRVLEEIANRDLCTINPNGVLSVSGRVMQEVWAAAINQLRRMMLANGAQNMIAVTEMLAVEYFGDPSSDEDGDGSSLMHSASPNSSQIKGFTSSLDSSAKQLAPLFKPLGCDLQSCWNPEDCYIYRTTLESGIYSILEKGASLQSPNSAYLFTLETDCSLSVKIRNGWEVWSNGVAYPGLDCYLELQGDGNLVVYDDNKNPLWAADEFCSGPSCQLSAIFVMQDDRNAVLYHAYVTSQQPFAVWGAMWATDTEIVKGK